MYYIIALIIFASLIVGIIISRKISTAPNVEGIHLGDLENEDIPCGSAFVYLKRTNSEETSK